MCTLSERDKKMRERMDARETMVCKICGLMQEGLTCHEIANKLNEPESRIRSLSRSVKRPDLKAD